MFAALLLPTLLAQDDGPKATVHALYDVISGPKGQERDWARFRTLFVEGAKMRVAVRRDGKPALVELTTEDYVQRAGPALVRDGFYEKEIAYREERYGDLAQVWSTYESRLGSPDAKPFDKGINAIQLVRTEGGWKVVAITWTSEAQAGPIPEKYLGG
jgi:hypothetical protein